MTHVTLPLGEWSPDLPALNNTGITVARNVVPLTPQSYGPLPDLAPFSGNRTAEPIPPLPSAPFGLYSFIDRNNNQHIFTGDSSHLYHFQTGDSAFQNVSGVTTHYTISDADVADAGSGYTAGDFVTLIWPTNGTTAQIAIDTVEPTVYHAATATLPTGGTLYTVGDVLTLVGGTFTTASVITVVSVDGGGVILTANFTTDGDYSVTPPNPVAVTGGTGSGATFTIDWLLDPISGSVLTSHIFTAGDYTSVPNSPAQVAGGTGDGLSFTVTTTVISTDAVTYHATAYNPWTLLGFGANSVLATSGDDPVQVMNLDTDNQFFDLNANRCPFAKYFCVARNFLILAHVTECSDGLLYPQRLHWSAIADAGTWPDLGSAEAAQLQSDAQDLRSDLGHIRGIGSNLQNADFLVLMDQGIYVGRYVGSPVIWDLQVVQGGSGCQVPRSLVINHGIAYYLSTEGFVAFDGAQQVPIGQNKIDQFLFNDPDDGADPNYLYLVQGSAHPTLRLIMWAYCGPDSNGVPNRILIYHTQLHRWTIARTDVAWLGRGLTTGFGMDSVDSLGNADTITPSFDDPYWSGGAPYLLAFDENFQVCSFSGPNLQAVIETQEAQPTAAKRSRLTSVRPLVDGSASSVAIGSRNRLEDAVTYAPDVSTNVWGETPQRVDARYLRGRVTIPAAAVWSHAEGVEVSFAPSSYR